MAPEKCGFSRMREYSCENMMEEWGVAWTRTWMEVARHDSAGPPSWEVWILAHAQQRPKEMARCFGFPSQPQWLVEARKPVRKLLCIDTFRSLACFGLPHLLLRDLTQFGFSTVHDSRLPAFLTQDTCGQKQSLSNSFTVLELSLEQPQWGFVSPQSTACSMEANLCWRFCVLSCCTCQRVTISQEAKMLFRRVWTGWLAVAGDI